MPSAALQALTVAVGEVELLLQTPPAGALPLHERLAKARVLGRASVVLLASHFERYFYAVNEEAVLYLNARGVQSQSIPEAMRLLHSARGIDLMLETQWQNRSAQLAAFVNDEAWLWTPGSTGMLRPDRLLLWMKSPKPQALVRYFAYWGIQDIFSHVTRTGTTRGRMFLLVSELIDKRNNIAHGDTAEQATRIDIQRYARTVIKFCGRTDRALALILQHRFRLGRPW